MLVAEGVVGNVGNDPSLAAARDRHEAAGTLERVRLDERERRRSRFRTTTDAGTELGVVLGDVTPEPGDVLLDGDDRLVIVEFERVEALAVTLPADLGTTHAVALGHALGNRHWDLAAREGCVYVATDGHRDRRRDALEEDLPSGASVTVEHVAPTLFDDAGGGHAHGHDHSHGPDEEGGTGTGISLFPGEDTHGTEGDG